MMNGLDRMSLMMEGVGHGEIVEAGTTDSSLLEGNCPVGLKRRKAREHPRDRPPACTAVLMLFHLYIPPFPLHRSVAASALAPPLLP
jgi:hypothetical protein